MRTTTCNGRPFCQFSAVRFYVYALLSLFFTLVVRSKVLSANLVSIFLLPPIFLGTFRTTSALVPPATVNMSHKCFQCDLRFLSSGGLVGHMREAHSSFVKDTQEKIDKSKQLSVAAKPDGAKTAAVCPFCKLQCVTRKNLMRHLEFEHKDDEVEDEPQVKIVRFNTDKSGVIRSLNSQITQPVVDASDPVLVQNLLRALEASSSAGLLDNKLKLPPAEIKIPERKYKCFWCEASFRKRGKLMDHIDMFHKDQTEMEAGSLSKSQTSTSTDDKQVLKLSATSVSTSVTKLKSTPQVSCSSIKAPPVSLAKPKSINAETGNGSITSATSTSKVCTYTLDGPLFPCRSKADPIHQVNSCSFYLGKAPIQVTNRLDSVVGSSGTIQPSTTTVAAATIQPSVKVALPNVKPAAKAGQHPQTNVALPTLQSLPSGIVLHSTALPDSSQFLLSCDYRGIYDHSRNRSMSDVVVQPMLYDTTPTQSECMQIDDLPLDLTMAR